jgi:hypothetical protein
MNSLLLMSSPEVCKKVAAYASYNEWLDEHPFCDNEQESAVGFTLLFRNFFERTGINETDT